MAALMRGEYAYTESTLMLEMLKYCVNMLARSSSKRNDDVSKYVYDGQSRELPAGHARGKFKHLNMWGVQCRECLGSLRRPRGTARLARGSGLPSSSLRSENGKRRGKPPQNSKYYTGYTNARPG